MDKYEVIKLLKDNYFYNYCKSESTIEGNNAFIAYIIIERWGLSISNCVEELNEWLSYYTPFKESKIGSIAIAFAQQFYWGRDFVFLFDGYFYLSICFQVLHKIVITLMEDYVIGKEEENE